MPSEMKKYKYVEEIIEKPDNFKLDRKLAILIDNFLCTIRQCRRNGSSCRRYDIGMS
jgi:hypothetical protein